VKKESLGKVTFQDGLRLTAGESVISASLSRLAWKALALMRLDNRSSENMGRQIPSSRLRVLV
jgi:hypothetical protein